MNPCVSSSVNQEPPPPIHPTTTVRIRQNAHKPSGAWTTAEQAQPLFGFQRFTESAFLQSLAGVKLGLHFSIPMLPPAKE